MSTRLVSWWRLVYWLLFVTFLVTAALNMASVSAGFTTNHLADFVCPALLYVGFRGLASRRHGSSRLRAFLGATPERSALILFVASTITELSQRYWPTGIFRGHFDPLDIVAFGAGLLPVYLADRLTDRAPEGAVESASRMSSRGDR
jgi:hypothetical protein